MSPFRRSLILFVLFLVTVPGMALAQIAQPRLLVDLYTGEVLFEENAGRPWHPASLTKLMTVFLAFEAIERGEASLSTPVTTSANALAVPPSRMGFPVDTAITLEDALYILVVKSANDIAVAVAETLGGTEAGFVAQMNQRAQQLGMSGTFFVNPHGLHDPRQVTTARDMALLAINIRLRFPQYDPLFSTHAITHAGVVEESNNDLLEGFAGTDGMKTGYVCASGLNIVATAERNGRSLLAVVLGGASSRDRGETTAQMLFTGFAGGYRGTGQIVTDVANRPDLGVTDMRPLICGTEAQDYVAARTEAFPAGLEGQVSYLDASIAGPVHAINPLGRIRDVPLPLPRPEWLPIVVAGTAVPEPVAMGDSGPPAAVIDVPLPLPRPAWL